MKKAYIVVAIFLFVLVASSILIHPYGHVKAAKAQKPFLQGAQIESPVFNILQNSCRNCHSDETVWPWYSYVAPVEWLVERDVRDARGYFNMSHWDEYTPQQRTQILAEVSSMIRNQKMPLRRYLFMHPGAKLSAEDVKLIDQWGHKERKRVKSESDHRQEIPVEMSPM
ncbi:MAG TPA: heme-binding domain-containing protein [Candidatus Angelobacter sp.]|nr:heme-binding domain-containing protein [Candidatus Angelobacter sp.]